MVDNKITVKTLKIKKPEPIKVSSKPIKAEVPKRAIENKTPSFNNSGEGGKIARKKGV